MFRRRPTLALCHALPEGDPPKWVELLPAGKDVVGRDGRKFRNSAPQNLVAAFQANGADLPLDWEHASELQAPKGQPAPAAGWLKELQARDGGSIWGRVEWTARGAESVKSREYRYLSPVFEHDKAGCIHRLLSAGLTNQPNLHLTALNHQEPSMDPEIQNALGLSDNASPSDVVAAIQKLQQELTTARNRANNPQLDKFVPRADYEAALNRATTAEQNLKTELGKKAEESIETELKAALKAGKITPATEDYHRAQCRQEGGLDRFREFVAAAPVIAGDTNLGNGAPNSDGTLNEAERAVCQRLELSKEEFLESLKEDDRC